MYRFQSCKNPDNGVIGKCCRDPNYVDPWPAGNLPANYSGGFDEQGFPTFLNIAKTRPPKKQQPVSGGATKGGRPIPAYQPQNTIPTYKPQNNVPAYQPQTSVPSYKPQNSVPAYKPQINQVPHQPALRPFPSLPNQITNIPQQIANAFGGGFQKPTAAPAVTPDNVPSTPRPFPTLPAVTPTTPRPSAVPNSFPSFSKTPSPPNPFPNFQNPFIKTNYDVSSSNQNPTIIAPHVPGSHCGLRNKVSSRHLQTITSVLLFDLNYIF